VPYLRPRLSSPLRFSHNDLGIRVEGDPRRAANDKVGAFPRPLSGIERHLLGHPRGIVGRRPVGRPVGPSIASAFAACGIPSSYAASSDEAYSSSLARGRRTVPRPAKQAKSSAQPIEQ